MAYSSISDARAKIIDPHVSNNSTILYGSNNLLNLTTTFYTDAALTSPAPQGNYVFVTNYITYYVTLNSSGMMTSLPEVVMLSNTDVSFVNDGLKNGTSYTSNQGSVGGTSLSLNGYLLTDAVWASRPYNSSKRWIIDCGAINSTAITNIDLSDMAGYDLRLVTGEWDGSKFTYNNNIYTIIHLAPTLNRIYNINNKTYFFRPDYWIPNSTFDSVSYFRRMPNIAPINNIYGTPKLWIDMAKPLQDVMEPVTHNDRTSTMMSKGITQAEQESWKKTIGGATQTFDIVPRVNRFKFNNDEPFKRAIAKAYNVTFNDVTVNSLWDNRICSMIESLTVTTNRNSWVSSFGALPYYQVNPNEWDTTFFGGYPNDTDNLVQQFSAFYYEISAWNGGHIQFDWEYLPSSLYSENLGNILNACFASARQTVYVDGNQAAAGAADPKYSVYGRGIYQAGLFGQPGFGWYYVAPGADAASTGLYAEYNNYYINSSVSYTTLSNYFPYFKGSINSFKYFFCSNYTNNLQEQWHLYNMVHSYDIARKIVNEILGTPNNDVKVCGYFWRMLEPLAGVSDWTFPRKYINWNGGIEGGATRIENSPSMMQSIAVWAMAYCDGLFMWEFGWVGEENQAVKDLQIANSGNFDTYQIVNTYYGDTTMVGKSSQDWAYIGYFQVVQNKDIVQANTQWLVPNCRKNDLSFTSGSANYPVMLYNQSLPLCRYKLSADGTEALVIIVAPYNNGYTKETHTLRLPGANNYEFTVDTWGNFTTVIRILLSATTTTSTTSSGGTTTTTTTSASITTTTTAAPATTTTTTTAAIVINFGSGFNDNVFSSIIVNNQITAMGTFSIFNTVSRNGHAQLNSNGSINTAFTNSSTGGLKLSVAYQASSSKYLIGGSMYQWGGVAVNYLIRVDASASLDTSFNSNLGSGFNDAIRHVSVQSNGKIIVSGNFGLANGIGREGVARLDADGILDTSYGTYSNNFGNRNAVALSSGKIFLAGDGTSYDGQSVSRGVYLNSDGTIYSAMGSGFAGGFNETLNAYEDGNGKIIVVGTFNTFDGVSSPGIVRLNADGTRDTSFTSPFATGTVVDSAAIRSDGKIIVMGTMTNYIACLNSNGSGDGSTYTFGSGFDVRSYENSVINITSNNTLIPTGSFTTFNGSSANRIVAILPN